MKDCPTEGESRIRVQRLPPSGGGAAPSLPERLERGAYLLALIDRLRKDRDLPHLGTNIERMIVDRELEDLAG